MNKKATKKRGEIAKYLISSVYVILSTILFALDNKPKRKRPFLNIKIPMALLNAEEIRGHLKKYCKMGK